MRCGSEIYVVCPSLRLTHVIKLKEPNIFQKKGLQQPGTNLRHKILGTLVLLKKGPTAARKTSTGVIHVIKSEERYSLL